MKLCKTPKKTTVPQAIVATNKPPTEWEVVVNSMDKDRLHEIIKSDDFIIQIWKYIYDSSKEKDGTIKARTAMRRLVRLVEATEGVTKAEQLFVVSNLYMLEQGIHNVC